MNVALIGCGLIGRKRAEALRAFPEDKLVVVCDTDESRAGAFARDYACANEAEWGKAIGRLDVDGVINSTINSSLAEITVFALNAGKHVLCEKPLGRNTTEARAMTTAARAHGLNLKTGFNHRFHPAVAEAKRKVEEGSIGRVVTIRVRYGHGGRKGMESEWRASKELSGGGELLDQGVHVIDLIRWFGGEVTEVYGNVETKIWDIPVEDNAFGILKTDRGVTAMFHVSWTNWRNVFSLEILGETGYLSIDGLGGSYGVERLEVGKRKPEGGRPDIRVVEFNGEDVSWKKEWEEFRNSIAEHRPPIGNGVDGLRANEIIEALYESSRTHASVTV